MKGGSGIIGCAVVAAAMAAPALPAAANGAAQSRMAIFRSQTKLIDSRLSQEYANSDRLRPKGSVPAYVGHYRGPYLTMARQSAESHDVPVDLFLRLVQQESGWSMDAVSTKGAIGLAQLMPETAARLGVDIHDARQNLDGGARYLKMMYDRYGSWKLALAAYNAGPDAVDRHGGVPTYRETQTYVASILGG